MKLITFSCFLILYAATALGQCNITLNLSFNSLICINRTANASVNASGGTPPYTYHWSNGSDSSTASHLFTGQFSVTVTDSSNCTASAQGTISYAPDFQTTSITKLHPCETPQYGSDTLLVFGGLSPFTFIIIGIDTNYTGIFDSIPPATYTWIVKDSLGCSKNGVFTIPDSMICLGLREISNINNLAINPNPGSGSITLFNLLPGTAINITNLIGEVVIKEVADNEKRVIDVSRLPKGMYLVNGKKFLKE